MLVEFEQNLMVRTKQNLEVFNKNWLTIFWQSVDAILEDVPVTETLVWCKNINLRDETVYVNFLVTVSCSLNISVVYFCN